MEPGANTNRSKLETMIRGRHKKQKPQSTLSLIVASWFARDPEVRRQAKRERLIRTATRRIDREYRVVFNRTAQDGALRSLALLGAEITARDIMEELAKRLRALDKQQPPVSISWMERIRGLATQTKRARPMEQTGR